jgi:hypothetical protein
MQKWVGYLLLFAFVGCAKLMEDQPPGSADSAQNSLDSAMQDTVAVHNTSKIPERFLQFFHREFVGTASTTSGRVHTLPVETIMDVTIELKSETPLFFMIKRDGLDVTEEPMTKWYGRLVPGKYTIAVFPSQQASALKATTYSIVVKEE